MAKMSLQLGKEAEKKIKNHKCTKLELTVRVPGGGGCCCSEIGTYLAIGCGEDKCDEELGAIGIGDELMLFAQGEENLGDTMKLELTSDEVFELLKHHHENPYEDLFADAVPASEAEGDVHPAELRLTCCNEECKDKKAYSMYNDSPVILRIPLQPAIKQLVARFPSKQIKVHVQTVEEVYG